VVFWGPKMFGMMKLKYAFIVFLTLALTVTGRGETCPNCNLRRKGKISLKWEWEDDLCDKVYFSG